MTPYVSGATYMNCPDIALNNPKTSNRPPYMHAYFGPNVKRLKEIKDKYDPTDLFKFPQSIPL